jgi:hypothetical protein
MKYVALGSITVHKLVTPETDAFKDPATNDAPSISVMLDAGDSLDESEVPYYVKDRYEAGLIPLLTKVSNVKASNLAKQAKEAQTLIDQTVPDSVADYEEGEGAVSSGPGKIGDIPASGITEIEGETLIVSAGNNLPGEVTGGI